MTSLEARHVLDDSEIGMDNTPPEVVGQLSANSVEQEVEQEIIVRPWDDEPDDEEEFIKLPIFDLGETVGDESSTAVLK
jgi:hypothetical protein